jgi:hypothetical protein
MIGNDFHQNSINGLPTCFSYDVPYEENLHSNLSAKLPMSNAQFALQKPTHRLFYFSLIIAN